MDSTAQQFVPHRQLCPLGSECPAERELLADGMKLMARPRETGWLIELRQGVLSQVPTWWGAAEDDDFDWTPDASKALRFARKEDAEAMIRYFGWTEASATDHAWE